MSPKDKQDFFNGIATEMNLLNTDDAKRYYYALVRYLIRSTKRDGRCHAPDLGVFEIRVFSGIRRRNLVGLRGAKNPEVIACHPIRIMKLVPDNKIKKFINQ